ncbi:MFS transporter [Nocardioides sp. KIGAM211]|uniref:MFS transporter n=1 Tax=Nocardioides luti TaxID=2761101 RepID=A0A7X0REH3_9ACTN|nr:MFS transporter [Nocardioides luti]MBB6626812.1 MFS transporter [Nocardioides luti]
MKWSESFAPMRERNFRWYFLSRTVNMTGGAMAAVALAFAVLEVSSSPSALGTVLAAHSIPMVVFLLAGGVIADRFGRKLVIQVSNVASGLSQLAIAGLVLGGHAQLWQIVVLSAVNGVVMAVSFPALVSVLPQLVPRHQLQPANVLMAMVRNSLTIVGPSVAGLLVVTAGAGWALAVDGISYLVAALLLLRVTLPPPSRQEKSSVVTDLREGWTYFRSTTWLWAVVLAFCLICAIHQGGYFTLGPVLAKQGDIGESGWGLILSAEAVGLLVTTLVMLRVSLQRPLFWGMIGTAAYGLPLIALGADGHLVTVVVASFLAGVGIEVFGLGWNLAMQENVPEDMLSRAFSYDAFGSFMAVPIGQLVAGPLALAFGIERVILVAGIALMAVALLTLLSRAVRDLPRVSTVEPATTTPAGAPGTA